MNQAIVIAPLCVLLTGCGETTEPETTVTTARLQASSEGLEECENDRCPEGLSCIEYRLASGPTKRCVTSAQVCGVLECSEAESCLILARLPGIALCAVIRPSP